MLRSAAAAETDAYAFTHHLHTHSRAGFVRVYERAQVLDFRDTSNGVELRTQKGNGVKARYLIHATGYESRRHLPNDVIKLNSTYALISEAGTAEMPWPENALILETARPYFYMRTRMRAAP